MSNLPKTLQLIRKDLSNLLIHFTKDHKDGDSLTRLKKIISSRTLKGGSGYITGGASQNCVCFTESPVNEMITYFNLKHILKDNMTSPQIRYAPYGIAFQKKFLFNKGARPVIYQAKDEFALLPEGLRYRHATLDLSRNVDFTWEREWRLKTDSFAISPNNAVILVPSFEDAEELMQEFKASEPDVDTDIDEEGQPCQTYCGTNYYNEWKIISLEIFGLEIS